MSYKLIRNGSLIDGTGANILDNAAVLLNGNVIEAVGPENKIKKPNGEVEEIDANNGVILPGFIDCHVHMMFEKYDLIKSIMTPFSYNFFQAMTYFEKTINAGVTSVRDAGGMDFGVKKAVDDGLFLGPRAKISINALSITGGHGDSWIHSGITPEAGPYPGMPEAVCDGVPEVRKRVREMLRAGAEVIKISSTGGVLSPTDRPDYTQFSPEELKAIVQEASFHGGKKVMSHAQGIEGIRQALIAGIYSIEHGIYLNEELINMMIKQGTFLVPTLFAPVSIAEDPEAKEKLPPVIYQKGLDVLDIHKESIKKAYKAGVKIAMGTDSGVMEHGRNLREMELLCEIGMTPMESIVATTKTAAECLEWDNKLGTIEQGKLADIVISGINPLDDIKGLQNTENIKVVVKDGKIVKDIR